MKLEAHTELPDLKVEPVTRTTLALFAAASGDPNPVHIDIDAARAAGFDDVFAHGMLSMAYVGRFLTSLVPQQRIRSLTGRFEALTPVGAEPTITAVVSSVDDADDVRAAIIDVAVTLGDGTRTMTGQAIVSLSDDERPQQ